MLVPFYQEIHDIQNDTTLGHEALIRLWHNNSYYSAATVLKHAARHGGLPALDNQIHRLAINQFEGDGLLFLNCTPQTLISRELSFPVDIDLSGLVMEITERAPLRLDSHSMADYLRPYRSAGLRVALDDFGTGWSSFHRIEALEPDFVKLDKSLLSGMEMHVHTRKVLAGMINFACTTGITLIAEGVETPEQVTILRNLGYQYIQGFYFDVPKPTRSGSVVIS
ncbi:EAL domain-containing protein [Alicyclobacillus tolerans]|uniref:EAL domain-containing protein n=1 Tax=Alicyclobacillus tolerans TaxID=90970 RepID=UPI001F217212|nr:EAL domain-containing protein [Alicyclobacillus tolerans]MCF8567929.1 EAL domain-containing protein [Alicyclobacillus tolerans]